MGAASQAVSPSGQKVNLTNIPIGTANVVTDRKIYRAKRNPDGVTYPWYKWVATLSGNSQQNFTDDVPDATVEAAAAAYAYNTTAAAVIGDLHINQAGAGTEDENRAALKLFYDPTGTGTSPAATAAGLWANIGPLNQNNNPGAPRAGQRTAEYWYFMSTNNDPTDVGVILYNCTLDLQAQDVGGSCAEFDIQMCMGLTRQTSNRSKVDPLPALPPLLAPPTTKSTPHSRAPAEEPGLPTSGFSMGTGPPDARRRRFT